MKLAREAPIPRVSLRVPVEAAASLGIREDTFNEHVRPHLRLTPIGHKLVVVSVTELERFLAKNGAILGERR